MSSTYLQVKDKYSFDGMISSLELNKIIKLNHDIFAQSVRSIFLKVMHMSIDNSCFVLLSLCVIVPDSVIQEAFGKLQSIPEALQTAYSWIVKAYTHSMTVKTDDGNIIPYQLLTICANFIKNTITQNFEMATINYSILLHEFIQNLLDKPSRSKIIDSICDILKELIISINKKQESINTNDKEALLNFLELIFFNNQKPKQKTIICLLELSQLYCEFCIRILSYLHTRDPYEPCSRFAIQLLEEIFNQHKYLLNSKYNHGIIQSQLIEQMLKNQHIPEIRHYLDETPSLHSSIDSCTATLEKTHKFAQFYKNELVSILHEQRIMRSGDPEQMANLMQALSILPPVSPQDDQDTFFSFEEYSPESILKKDKKKYLSFE